MIEIVCKDGLQEEKKEGNISLPRNIRQVGSPGGRHKIYIEDYVYTYLKAVAGKKESCAAVFLGKSRMAKDIRYTFVNGALECGSGIFQWDKICLDDSFWKNLEREQKKYFPDREIVGWFLGKAGQALELSPAVEAAHRKYFSGRDKVLMLMDVLEEEEIFFIYDQGYLQKREGYYIYYEKNIPMQEYMIHKKDEEQRLGELAAEEESRTEHSQTEENRTEHSQTEENRTEHSQTEKNRTEHSQTEVSEAKSGHTPAEMQDSEAGNSQTEISDGKRKKPGAEPGDTKQERPHGETGDSGTERLYAGMHHLKQGSPHGETGDSEQRNTQLKLEEFRKLRRELRADSGSQLKADTGSQEKIFARSNLEEPKTQAEEALESYRNMMVTRHGRQVERQNRRFLYTASSFFLVAVCVLGITTINNYRKMQEVEDVLHVMRSGESAQKRSENQDGVVVESVESQVKPLEEGQQAGDGEEQGNAQTDQAADSPDGQPQGTTPDTKGAQSEEPSGNPDSGQSEGAQGNTGSGQSEGAQGNTGGQPEGTQGNTGSGQPEGTQGNTGSGQSEGTQGNAGSPQPGEAAENSGGEENKSQETSAEQPRYYTVQPGDTLASICINIYHSRDMMKKVCEANGIEDGDKIYAGQKLLLP
ncbi:MAG: LysM peptidoglycan-binding domain-containing protein [Lachnospiraceae bacterium]|nr:LysM peptidoglycan-binding domain-containing protein [Lachnospiraceae bacterium]